jgi:PIN domain nuclease of toxin-antitoxin system
VDDKSCLDNVDLPWEHRDPVDRTIVALATRFDCLVVTSDRVIADYYSGTF